MSNGFGMAHIKGEGKPLHPDDIDADMNDEQYERQLKAYNDAYPPEKGSQ
jgi:hypothetical protein